jgi:hypothetical protein
MRDRAFTPVPWWDFVQVVLQVSVAVAGFLVAWLVWQRVRAYVGRQDAEQDALRIGALIKAMRSSGFDLDVPGGPATLMPAPGNTGSRWTSPCANCSHPVSIHDEAGVCTAKECIETARGQGITRWDHLACPATYTLVREIDPSVGQINFFSRQDLCCRLCLLPMYEHTQVGTQELSCPLG